VKIILMFRMWIKHYICARLHMEWEISESIRTAKLRISTVKTSDSIIGADLNGIFRRTSNTRKMMGSFWGTFYNTGMKNNTSMSFY
jgi:hypothetical protein